MTEPFLEVSAQLRRPEFVLDVTLNVARGETVAVLGPNGAGKSTLLGVLAGLLRPDRGRVVLDGRVLTDTEAGIQLPTHRREVGLLAQQALLFPHLSARANVEFGPRCAGRSRAEATRIAARWLADVDLAEELAARRPGQLSGGQAQRVALARALAGEPKLLLLDEPLAALDIDSAPALRALLRRVLRAAGQTALLVTHDVLDAVVLADRLIVLTDGAIVEQGRTHTVLTRPRSSFAARVAGLNLITGTGAAEGLRSLDGELIRGMHPYNGSAGEPAVAVFPPSAVAVYRDRPAGSPRNVAPMRLEAIEPRGEVVRLRAAPIIGGPTWVDGVAADITPAALAELAGSGAGGAEESLAPGASLWIAIKAAEVAVHAAGYDLPGRGQAAGAGPRVPPNGPNG